MLIELSSSSSFFFSSTSFLFPLSSFFFTPISPVFYFVVLSPPTPVEGSHQKEDENKKKKKKKKKAKRKKERHDDEESDREPISSDSLPLHQWPVAASLLRGSIGSYFFGFTDDFPLFSFVFHSRFALTLSAFFCFTQLYWNCFFLKITLPFLISSRGTMCWCWERIFLWDRGVFFLKKFSFCYFKRCFEDQNDCRIEPID